MADTEALKSGDILGGMGVKGFDFGGLGFANIILIILGVIVLFILIGIGVGYWLYRRRFNQSCYIFGLIGGSPALKLVDRAMIKGFGMAGDTLFMLRKKKKYIAPPTIQMGKNTWWFWERKDGELINFGLENIDEKMEKANVNFVDTDMRMQRLGIEKNLRDRFEKESFWGRYGNVIVGTIFVVLVTVALVVLFAKLVDVAKALEKTAGSVSSMASQVEQFYSKRVGGQAPSDMPSGNASGLVPALILVLFNHWRLKWQVKS